VVVVGTLSSTVTGSPYWKLMKDRGLSRLPAPDGELRATGLEVYKRNIIYIVPSPIIKLN
jgi:hypothetical protein